MFRLTTEERLDYIIFLGTFYHLKYGTIVLDRLAEMTKERLFFQTLNFGHYIESFIPKENYQGKEAIKILDKNEFPKMYFIENKFEGGETNWQFTNDSCVEGLIRSSGLNIIARPHKNHYISEPFNVLGKRIYDTKFVFPVIKSKGEALLPL